MTLPNFYDALIRISSVFPLIANLVFVAIAAFGVFVGYKGLANLYALFTGEAKFSNHAASFEGAFAKLFLSGAFIVTPVIFWRFANTFVLGGSETYNLFVIGSGSQQGSYCKQIHSAISYVFMGFGAIAWGFAALILYDQTNNQRIRTGSPWTFLVGGVLCFFVNDASIIVSNTLGMQMTFENICSILGDGS